ncbi:helix-turn-helix domain-containing protein [Sphingomonas sp. M6A6_1c]
MDDIPSPSFSPRERQVLEHLAIGSSNKRIAIIMAIAEDTVRDHVKSILRKTGLENRTQVALWAVGPGAWQIHNAMTHDTDGGLEGTPPP